MKTVVKYILRLSAQIALKRNKYKIVAVTGSTGKTSTKKAISLVLSSKYEVLTAEEGYNTEFGLPLAILQMKVPKSKAGWLPLTIISVSRALRKTKYDYCVLEMGADKPGDIEYLLSVVQPNIAVVTNVSGVHLEEFKDIDSIVEEKAKIFAGLKEGDFGILNADNKYVKNMKVPKEARKITFGRESKEIHIVGQKVSEKGSVNKLNIEGEGAEIKTRALGGHLLYVFGAAAAVGVGSGMNVTEIIKGLNGFIPVKGRLNVIKGINDSTIIDDSYNANPASMKNAIDALADFKGRRIAVLGTMGELGDYEKEAHAEIGAYLIGKCDILVTVGDTPREYLAETFIQGGAKKESVLSFKDSLEAGGYLKDFIKKGDVILLKGSQNASRMEKAVREIMKNPDDAPKLLCRQGPEWENK